MVMSHVRLPERETLRRPASPRAFPPEIWWVGVWRSKALRARASLLVPKVVSVAQPGCWNPGVGRCHTLIHVEGPLNVHGRSALFRIRPAVSAARLILRRAGRFVVNTLKVSQDHERPPVYGVIRLWHPLHSTPRRPGPKGIKVMAGAVSQARC
jgi:hypothetical protein